MKEVGARRGISASFHPLCRPEVGWPGGNGERDGLNYNPLRDTAEFAFKIKRA